MESIAADAEQRIETAGQRAWRKLRPWLVLLVLGFSLWGGYRAYVHLKVQGLEQACKAAQQSEAWAQLEINATSWAIWQPDRVEPWLYASAAAQELGDIERMAGYLSLMPAHDARALSGLLELSHLQFGPLNQPLEAAATCRRILEIEPTLKEAHRRLLFFYAMTRQRALMMAEARRAIESGSDTPETYVYLVGADWMVFTNGSESNNRWLLNDRDEELFLVAGAIHLIGARALDEYADQLPPEEGQPKTQYYDQLMDQLATRFPQNLEILAFYLARGTTRGNVADVAELLSEAPPASFDDSRFWRAKGWYHAAREQWKEAEVAYQQAITLHPYDWQSQHELSAVMRRLERFDEVARLQEQSMHGKELMRQVLQSPDTQSMGVGVLSSIQEYAAICGDDLVEKTLAKRIAQMGGTPGQDP